jgi:hypothetical protein
VVELSGLEPLTFSFAKACATWPTRALMCMAQRWRRLGCTPGHTWGTRLRLSLASAPRLPTQTKIESPKGGTTPGQGSPTERVSTEWDDI